MSGAARPTRFDRLYAVLKVLLVQEKFTLAEMKERLPHEAPGYVTRLVHQLEGDGHLRENDGVYSWTRELSRSKDLVNASTGRRTKVRKFAYLTRRRTRSRSIRDLPDSIV